MSPLKFHSLIPLCIIAAQLLVTLKNAAGQKLTEPDYQHLYYGNVWRHIIFAPTEDHPEILDATKQLQSILDRQQLGIILSSANLRCISQNMLWYTERGEFPLIYDSYVNDRHGQQYPVSVPVSIGDTFNFLLTVRASAVNTTHAFTITRNMAQGQYYLYAHTSYSVNSQNTNKQESGSTCELQRVRSSSSAVLSSLALSKTSERYPGPRCKIFVNAKLRQEMLYEKPKPLQDVIYESHFFTNHSIPKDISTKTGQTDREVVSLTVMSYNIWNFNPYQRKREYIQRMQRISELLRLAQPDIVGFQEVRFEQALGGKLGPSQVEHLAAALSGYQYIFQPAQLMRESFVQGRTEEGVAIFSKYPIIHHDYLLLFRNERNSADQHQRICLHAVIHVPGAGRVHVFNTHLSLSHEAREESVTQILQFMQETGGEERAVLLGDLNATPEERAIRRLSSVGSGLLDVWTLLNASSRGFTFSTLEEELSKRIDYIMMRKSQKWNAQTIKVLPDGTKLSAASDHRPLMATFHLKAQEDQAQICPQRHR